MHADWVTEIRVVLENFAKLLNGLCWKHHLGSSLDEFLTNYILYKNTYAITFVLSQTLPQRIFYNSNKNGYLIWEREKQIKK